MGRFGRNHVNHCETQGFCPAVNHLAADEGRTAQREAPHRVARFASGAAIPNALEA
jgi:hypothetical protein